MITRSPGVCAAVALVGAAGFVLMAAGDPLADLKSGSAAIDAKRFPAAIQALDGLSKRLPKLADYAGWMLASARSETRDYAGVLAALDPIWKQAPPSPLIARASLLASKAYSELGQTASALDVLRSHYSALPQPQGDLAMAAAFSAAGDAVSAVIYNQRVYYNYPLSAEAAQAASELDRLQAQLGDTYPPSTPLARLDRAVKLMKGSQTARAKKELTDLIPQLGGAERDLARVRLGEVDYIAKQEASARTYLSSLDVAPGEPDAERLYYLVESARRLKKYDEMNSLVEQLGQQYPNSSHRVDALVSVANYYLTDNASDQYEPLYRACYQSFPTDSQAATCHWKVTWLHYLRRQADAGDLLREHLKMYPASDDVSAAMYYLGRLAQQAKDGASARVYFEAIARDYPNQYYAAVARERLSEMPVGAQIASDATAFLRTVSFPQRSKGQAFSATPTAQARIERSRLLVSAGLRDLAEIELRFGAQNEDQPHVLAMELAKLTGEDKPDQGIRYIKRYANNYLFLPIESAPLDFWRLAFPLPYRNDLERYSRDNNVDPFLMAALIRQESEFDSKAVSKANARGLTQIEPTTGKEISRRLKAPAFTTAKLFDPSVNLRFGTYYFKQMTDSLNGNVAAALAAYNAGLSRANAWLKWGDFREPAEFVETVPFTQTRGYIQAVLRNADAYRRIYGMNERASK